MDYPSREIIMAIAYQTDKEARESLASGVRKLAQLVTITLGPKGRNVALDKKWSAPSVVHDGVSVAKEVELPNKFENMGAQLVLEAASKTADRAGDGTTTATLLAWKLVDRGMRLIEEGVNPMMMKEGMDKAVSSIVHTLTSQARKIEEGDLLKVATISAANPEMGKIIATALEKVGKNGVITVEEGMGEETTIEFKEGMMFDKGYGSPAFVTNEKKMIAEILNPYILYTDMAIDSLQDFSDFLDNVLTEKDRNIVIIADAFEGMTLPFLLDNHKKGFIRAIAVQAPSFGNKRIWALEDMAALTGGTVITRQSGRLLSSITIKELGRADKVWADADNTKIIGGHADKSIAQERINALTDQIKSQESEFEKRQLLQRIAKLSGGVAIIKVGARTEAELKDRKERLNDAVEATKSAVAEGIIAGGGIALLEKCQDSSHLLQQEDDKDIIAGINLVFAVLDEPIKRILKNAGRNEETIIEKIREKKLTGYGYNIITNEYGNMFELGVVDPVRVTRQALQNATSVASMILTTEGLITQLPEDAKSPLEQAVSLA